MLSSKMTYNFPMIWRVYETVRTVPSYFLLSLVLAHFTKRRGKKEKIDSEASLRESLVRLKEILVCLNY